MIPFSPPRIDQKIIDEVVATLKSGWITTGPRTKLFEKKLSAFNGNPNTLCLNSGTAALELMLRWFGIKEGDEVIVPAYTYAATANVVVHCGAKPIIADINEEDFNISHFEIAKHINSKTKAVIPVDVGGFPCDYDEINRLAKSTSHLFKPASPNQEKLGRMLILSDSAHALGAEYNGKKIGSVTDVAAFSFHAVKNLSTAEGGAVSLNLPSPFDNEEEYKKLCMSILHGQNKDALAKQQNGNWKYDIVEAGYKCNMTDIQAAMGLVELDRYQKDTLQKRRSICELYHDLLKHDPRIELPLQRTKEKQSSWHLFSIRIRNITEAQRDRIIQKIFDKNISVNVHFIPLPCLSFYKNAGYNINDFPVAWDNYSRVISLPVYYDLTTENIKYICNTLHAVLNDEKI